MIAVKTAVTQKDFDKLSDEIGIIENKINDLTQAIGCINFSKNKTLYNEINNQITVLQDELYDKEDRLRAAECFEQDIIDEYCDKHYDITDAETCEFEIVLKGRLSSGFNYFSGADQNWEISAALEENNMNVKSIKKLGSKTYKKSKIKKLKESFSTECKNYGIKQNKTNSMWQRVINGR